MRGEERGPWYLLTGLLIGAALGVLYTWIVQPVEYTNTTPASLRADFKDQYRALIASAYMADGDLVRARARLDLLQDEDILRVLGEQAQRTLAGAGQQGVVSAMQEARALGVLAVALGQPPATVAPPAGLTPSPPLLQSTATPEQGTPAATASLAGAPSTSSPSAPGLTRTPGTTTAATSLTPASTRTPLPTRTFTTTVGALFALQSQELACPLAPGEAAPTPQPGSGQTGGTPLIVLQTYDAAGQGVPGVEVVVHWDGGENRFFTGLKSELGLGYADFNMTPGVTYTLQLAEGGQIIPDLTASECEAPDGSRYWGSWMLVFKQP